MHAMLVGDPRPLDAPKRILSCGRLRTDRLVIFLLSLGIYIIVTSGIVTRLSSEGSIVSSATLRTLDLPTTWRGSEIGQTDDDGWDYTCDSQNSTDFLPEGDAIRRAMHGVVVGTMKGGTQAIHKMLLAHPRILTSGTGHGELHFFNNRGLRKHLPRLSAIKRVTPRQDLREGFEFVLNGRHGFKKRKNGTLDIMDEKNKDKVGLHSAPIYLFSGRSVPARLLCVAPWAKILALLRNPIDRALSHYNFVHNWGKYKGMTFRQFVYEDIRLLKKHGVIRDWSRTNFTSFSGSAEEFASWERYIHKALVGPVGRGLYAVQLEIWFQEFGKVNKSVEEDFLVLQSEETRENPHGAYRQAVEFLGLEPRKARRRVIERRHHKTQYVKEGIHAVTYKKLYELFEPYNKRLYALLGEDDWGGVWDDE